MSVESLFSESLSEESNDSAENTDEEEAEDSEEYLDLLWIFWDLMSFEHIHNNNAVIDHEVSRLSTVQSARSTKFWPISMVINVRLYMCRASGMNTWNGL